MREILFRGKTEKGEWVRGVPFFEEWGCYIIEGLFICDEYDCTGAVNSMILPDTVGQYTGLTDKNGKKIFEGDIVMLTSPTGEKYKIFVRFKEAKFEFFGLSHPSYFASRYAEVIGNIHDNPELLKGGAEE